MRAIRLDPESARAYAARKTVLMGLKDWPAMFEAIDKAVLLAPNDTYLLGDVGIESILGRVIAHWNKCKIETPRRKVYIRYLPMAERLSASFKAHRL